MTDKRQEGRDTMAGRQRDVNGATAGAEPSAGRGKAAPGRACRLERRLFLGTAAGAVGGLAGCFKGGDWVMNLPPPPQRCPPSPYERACLVAWYFKHNRIKGRVTILDHKDDVRPIGPGFKAAFRELYGDYITYVPNAHIEEVDPFNRQIRTSAGDLRFDHAVLMAPHQAGDLCWLADAIGRNAEGKATGWADVDPIRLHLKSDPRVYVIGDAVGFVSKQFAYYPKSAHVANRMGRIVAAYIAEQVAGREPAPALPDNLCYMLVNNGPQEAISVQFDYSVDRDGMLVQQQIDDNDRRPALVAENFRWARLMFGEMFDQTMT